MNALIVDLQHTINRFSADVNFGFSPIAADGIFGKGSLAALLLALSGIGLGAGDNAADAFGFVNLFNTPEDVVQHLSIGPGVTMMLAKEANVVGRPVRVAPSKDPPTKLPRPTGAVGLEALEKFKREKAGVQGSIFDVFYNLPMWVKVGGGLVALGSIVFVVTKKKKSRSALPVQGWY
jgi:hypothetical protein